MFWPIKQVLESLNFVIFIFSLILFWVRFFLSWMKECQLGSGLCDVCAGTSSLSLENFGPFDKSNAWHQATCPTFVLCCSKKKQWIFKKVNVTRGERTTVPSNKICTCVFFQPDIGFSFQHIKDCHQWVNVGVIPERFATTVVWRCDGVRWCGGATMSEKEEVWRCRGVRRGEDRRGYRVGKR
jgi:hypothetical protein